MDQGPEFGAESVPDGLDMSGGTRGGGEDVSQQADGLLGVDGDIAGQEASLGGAAVVWRDDQHLSFLGVHRHSDLSCSLVNLVEEDAGSVSRDGFHSGVGGEVLDTGSLLDYLDGSCIINVFDHQRGHRVSPVLTWGGWRVVRRLGAQQVRQLIIQVDPGNCTGQDNHTRFIIILHVLQRAPGGPCSSVCWVRGGVRGHRRGLEGGPVVPVAVGRGVEAAVYLLGGETIE